MFDSARIELALDDLRRPLFFESEYGLAMDIAPDLDDLCDERRIDCRCEHVGLYARSNRAAFGHCS